MLQAVAYVAQFVRALMAGVCQNRGNMASVRQLVWLKACCIWLVNLIAYSAMALLESCSHVMCGLCQRSGNAVSLSTREKTMPNCMLTAAAVVSSCEL